MSSKQLFYERSKRSFHKFCDGTSMHGFTELYYTKNIFWLSFWTIAIGAAIGVTVYQVYRAVDQFIEQPTTNVIQLATSDDMLYPTLKVCYPHWLYWVDWEKGINMNFTKESILYGLSYLSVIYSANKFNESEAKENFILKMNDNHIATITEFYAAIAMDNSKLIDNLNETVISASISYDFEKDQTKFCQIVEGKDIPRLIEDEQHERYKTKKLRKTSKSNFLQFKVLTRQTLNTEYTNELEYMKYVDDISNDFFQITIFPNTYDTNGVIVTDQSEMVSISIKTSIHKWKNTPQMPCEVDLKWITMNSTCSYKCYSIHNITDCMPLWFYEAFLTKTDIPSKNIYRPAIHFLDTFYNDTEITIPYAINTTDTLQTNFTEITEQSINNTSYSDAQNDSIGNLTNNDECYQLYVNQIEEISNCTKDCDSVTGCQVYTFDFNSQTVSLYRTMTGKEVNKVGEGILHYTKVIIEYATENEVLLMIEQDTQTWEGFVGNVGGLLGIWTGASILSFIQLVYLCFCTECDPHRIHREGRVAPKDTKIINLATTPH